MAKKTDEEIMDLKASMEFKANYDLGHPFKDEPHEAQFFWGYLAALRWVLGDCEPKEKTGSEIRDELGSKELNVTLNQQAVIEFAYAIRGIVEPLAENHDKLSFDEANCFKSIFSWMRRFLKQVDPEYLKLHAGVVGFYSKRRELSKDNDRLWWEPDKKETAKEQILCQDKATCPFGKECDGGWDSVDPQTDRLCRDALHRNFAKVKGPA